MVQEVAWGSVGGHMQWVLAGWALISSVGKDEKPDSDIRGQDKG